MMRLLHGGLPIIGSILAGGRERINGMYVLYGNDGAVPICDDGACLQELIASGRGGYARVRITSAVADKDTGAVTFSAMVTEEDCKGAKPEAGRTCFTSAILAYMPNEEVINDVFVASSGFVGKSGEPVCIKFNHGVYVVINTSLRFGA